MYWWNEGYVNTCSNEPTPEALLVCWSCLYFWVWLTFWKDKDWEYLWTESLSWSSCSSHTYTIKFKSRGIHTYRREFANKLGNILNRIKLFIHNTVTLGVCLKLFYGKSYLFSGSDDFFFSFFLYCSFKKSVLLFTVQITCLWSKTCFRFHFYLHNMKCCCTSMVEISVLFVISHLSGIRAVYRTSLFLLSVPHCFL